MIRAKFTRLTIVMDRELLQSLIWPIKADQATMGQSQARLRWAKWASR